MPRVGGTFEFGPVAPRLREAIGIFQGRRLETWPSGLRSHRYGIDCASLVTVASRGPVPSMIAAKVRGGTKASGVKRRM